MNKKNVVFVTEIKALSNKEATSTHIMSYNLLKGFKDNECKITLIAIYTGDDEQSEEIKKYYASITDRVFCVKSRIGNNLSKYSQLIKMFYYTFLSKKHKKDIPSEIDLNDSILISHNPSIESICLCKYLKNKCSKYVQYWSDPIAISGILPEDLSIKRVAHKVIEKKCLSYADKIIYGTKVLLDAQKTIYKKYANKMDYIDISYIEKNKTTTTKPNNRFLYAGNYYSSIRNIYPLYQAFNDFKLGELTIYGSSDLQLSSTECVKVNGRISLDQLTEIENEYYNIVCVGNVNCLQIPGKIFYDMNKNKNILVVLDGKYKEEIKSYLDSYNRFITCYNTAEAIKEAIQQLEKNKLNNEYALENYSPKMIIKTFFDKI